MYSLFKQAPMNRLLQFEVDGVVRKVKAGEISHQHHNMFKVCFENGYENIFFTDVETGEWIEEDIGFTSLAASFGREIQKYLRSPYHVPKLLTWHNQYVKGRYIKFGFYHYISGSQKFYQIYNASRKYLYTLTVMENDEWLMLGNINNSHSRIDIFFLKKIIDILPLYTSKVR